MTRDGGKLSKRAFHEFVSEAEELIEKLLANISDMEGQLAGGKIHPDLLNEIFRGAHSLKGLAGMFGLVQMSQLSHNLENLLDNLRLGKVNLTNKVFNILLEGVQILRKHLEKLNSGGSEEENEFSDFITKLTKTISEGEVKEEESILDKVNLDKNVLGVLTEYEEHRLKENIKSGANIFKVSAVFDLSNFDQELSKLNETLKSLGEIITTLPSAGAPGEAEIKFDLIVGSEKDSAVFKEALKDFGVTLSLLSEEKAVKRAPVEEQKTTEKKGEEKGQGAQEEIISIKSVSQTVRVDISKLDYIMNIVGELVLSKTQLSNIASRLRTQVGFTGIAAELYKTTRELERRLNELRLGVMGIRMVPLRQVFDKLVRAVRRISVATGKEVTIEIFGSDTELDKLIIEELGDPLMHIIRNSIDHGIELPEERKKAGKPPVGKIVLNGYQKGNHVVIEVSDDGRGIDLEKVLNKAKEKGLVNKDAILSKQEIYELLFTPGFSTKETVSETSGRGVGLDVVKNNIAALSGMIDIESEPGKGTKFILTLPITLAIIQALFVGVNNKTFAIPLSSVLESLVIQSKDIKTVEKKKVTQLRDSTLPLLHLSEIFNLGAYTSNGGKFFVVVVGLAEKRLGLMVDQLMGQQDIVIKPIGEVLKNVRGIAGATELGTNQTVLVLDVGAILDEALKVREA
jgi:two-component system chemotaxis sensor kinase CheA